jgi:predicted permease
MVALYIGVVTTVYNIIAVWLLDSSGGVLNKLIKNPILMGIVAGTLASLVELPIPVFIQSTGEYLSDLTLPLALLCIGATLEFSSLRGNGRFIALVVFFKLIFSPLLLVGLGLLVGLDNVALGILFYMAASPTATASYIMARQLTSHGTLAAEIVAVTTAVGVLIYTAGLAVLRSSDLI